MNTLNLQSTHWQLAPNDEPNAVLQGVDDIHACIANILATQKDTDILRPEFGSDHFRYIDYPEDEALPHFVREITQALNLWETRIMVEEVQIEGQAPYFTFTVMWSLTDDVARQIYTTEV